ncbi:MAG: Hpt domain-containing protein [Candidatus Omnitrophota bacterium]
MTDTDKIFMMELKNEFMESVTVNLKQMSQLFEEDKFDEIAKIAHDIKGTSGIFGLDEGTEIAKELQAAAQSKDVEKVKKLIDDLVTYMKANDIIK